MAESVAWTSLDGVNWTVVEEEPPFIGQEATIAWFNSATSQPVMEAWIVDDQVLTSIAGGPVIAWTPEGLGVARR
jgi:hypothetical protein